MAIEGLVANDGGEQDEEQQWEHNAEDHRDGRAAECNQVVADLTAEQSQVGVHVLASSTSS